MKKLFTEILKTNGKFSQGRVYLFWSICAFYASLVILMGAGITNAEIDIDRFDLILEALEYAMTLFGGYVFGGKFIDVVKNINFKKDNNEKS